MNFNCEFLSGIESLSIDLAFIHGVNFTWAFKKTQSKFSKDNSFDRIFFGVIAFNDNFPKIGKVFSISFSFSATFLCII